MKGVNRNVLFSHFNTSKQYRQEISWMQSLLCGLGAEEENLTRLVEYLSKATYLAQKRTRHRAIEKDPGCCSHQRHATRNNAEGIDGHPEGPLERTCSL